MMSNEVTETVEEYVRRVGTVFAVAVYRGFARNCYEKISTIRSARDRMAAVLDIHFESNIGDENIFEAALESYESNLLQKAKEWDCLESEAIRLDLPGTDPGSQSHLDGNGIKIDLELVRKDLQNPGVH